MIRRAIALAATLALAPGCGPHFDHLDVAPTTAPPLPVTISATHVGLPEGIAVGVDVTPMNDSGEPLDPDVTVTLSSSDEGIVGVAVQTSANKDGSGDSKTSAHPFVFFGVRAGSAKIHVEVDGQAGADIAATVAAQP